MIHRWRLYPYVISDEVLTSAKASVHAIASEQHLLEVSDDGPMFLRRYR